MDNKRDGGLNQGVMRKAGINDAPLVPRPTTPPKGQTPAEESKFTDLELLIREQACNGTQDCENGPECPDGYDGCIATDLADDVCQHLDDVMATEFEAMKVQFPMLVATLSSKNLTVTEYMSAAVDTYRAMVMEKLREETER